MAETIRREPSGHQDDRERAVADEARVRAEAEARGADLPQPGSTAAPMMTGAEAAKLWGEGTVKMNVPHAFMLTRENDMTMIRLDAGIQEVPESMKDHPYLKAHGVKPV